MAASIETLVFTPVGPSSKLEYVRDTVESFVHYMDPATTALLLINDTGRQEIRDAIAARPNIVIVDAPPRSAVPSGYNTFGNSFANQIDALRRVSGSFDWRCALRLDDDALIIGPRPDVDALSAFRAGDKVGMLGAYRFRGDGSNKEADMAQQGRRLLRAVLVPRGLKNLGTSSHLLKIVVRALMNGYTLGHMCTGGAFFISREAFEAASRLVGDDTTFLRTLALVDDLLFSLYCSAGGFKMADFSRKQDVMAINFRGLPMPLDELVRCHKKVIHPVKDVHRAEHEKEVRSFFKELRV